MGTDSQGKQRNMKGCRFEGFLGKVVLSFEVQDVKILGNFINHVWVPLGRRGCFDVFCQSQIGSQKLKSCCPVVRSRVMTWLWWKSLESWFQVENLGKVGVPTEPGKQWSNKNQQGIVWKAPGSVQVWNSVSPLDISLLHAIQRNTLKKERHLTFLCLLKSQNERIAEPFGASFRQILAKK